MFGAHLPWARLTGARTSRARLAVPSRLSGLGRTSATGLVLLALLLPLLVLLALRMPWPSLRGDAEPVDLRPFTLGAPLGSRTTPAFNLVVALDESGSTTSSDKANNRGDQVKLLMQWLRIWGSPEDYLAVVRFADQPIGWGPVAVTNTPAGLPEGDVGGGTAFEPVLRDAAQRLNEAPSPQNVVVLLTDGQGDDPKPAIRRFPASTQTFVLGLDDNGEWTAARRGLWAGVLAGSWRLRNLSPVELATPLAALLSRLTGQHVEAVPDQSPFPA